MTVIRVILNALAGADSGNHPPVWNSSVDQTLTVGTPFSLNLDDICDDPDGDAIAYSQISGSLPPGLSLNGSLVSGTPTTSGDYAATFDAVDFQSLGTTFTTEGSGTEFVTFGHPFLAGEVENGLKIGVQTNAGVDVTCQCDIRATHDDDSCLHAVITAQVTGGTTYRLVTKTQSGVSRTVADLLSAIPGSIASVILTGGVTGTMTVRDLLESATNRAKLNNTSSYLVVEQGPTMLGVVVSQDFDTHVRLTMHLRWYGGTQLWCSYLFENGYVNLNGMTSRSYTATLVLNGVTMTGQAMTSPVHYNRGMWRKAFWSSGGTIYARLSASALIASKALPNYDISEAPTDASLNSQIQSVEPMTNGDLDDSLGGTGAHHWIGLETRWGSSYLTSNCDERAYNWMIANSDAAMSYQFSGAMDSVTGEHLSISDRPTYTAQNPGALGSGYTSGLSPYGNSSTGQPASHAMAAGYMAYLVTGDWAYLRSLHGWASFETFWTDSNRNRTYNGATIRKFYYGSIRGVAWSYRTVGQAAYLTPDDHYLKTYYNNTVNGNLIQDYTDYGPTFSSIGVVEGSEGISQYRSFMHFFLAQSVAYLVCDLGFANGLNFAQSLAKYIAGLMGNTGEYNWCFATAQDHAVAATDEDAYYTTFTQIDDDTRNVPTYAQSLAAGSQALADAMETNGDIPNNIAGTMTGAADSSTGYPSNIRPAVSYLGALGVTGAAQCWTNLNQGLQADYQNEPQFNVAPR